MATEGIRMSEAPEMVERVALATCTSKPCTCRHKVGFKGRPCLGRAISAIEAMRVPTEVMLCECADAWGEPIGTGKDFWQAMIDAALKE
jgi:hypothetical protein